jgi:MarR-like DNA-binding transcriptional regulator SgrR of sgrS sRNA
MAEWSLLTNHARVIVCIAGDPGMRLRDIAATLDISERNAHTIISELTEAGYVVKEKHGRRNRYQIQEQSPLHESAGHKHTVGELLETLLNGSPSADPDHPHSQLDS